MKKNLIVITGPTAVGKTRLAVLLANELEGEIISADSRQVYTGMDIGTGKDLDEYLIDEKKIPYHLIDICNPATDEFNLYKFNQLFFEAFRNISQRGKTPFLTGGTGLYIHSLIKKYELKEADFSEKQLIKFKNYSIEELQEKLKKLNLKLHNTTDLISKERLIKAIIIAQGQSKIIKLRREELNPLVIGIKTNREEVKRRITERLKKRLENGMIEETENLIKKGVSYDKLLFFGLEYKFVGLYLKKEINKNDMFQKLNSSIHKFAKRQMTWFRKMEKEGVKINWIDDANFETAKEIIQEKYL